MKPKIRRLAPRDAAEFLRVRLRSLREEPEAFLASPSEEVTVAELRRSLRPSRDRAIMGAFLDGRLAGVVGVTRDGFAKARHKAVIWGVYVAPEARGLGLGRMLMRRALAHIRRAGVEQVLLSVGTTNRAARALYAACGFRGFGIERRCMKVGRRYVDEEWMVLRLR